MFDLWLKGAVRWLAVVGLCLFIFCLWASLNDASAADVVVAAPTVTLQSAVADIIGQATSGVKAGVAFLQQEIPDVIRQLLIWKATLAGFWAALYAFLVVVGIIALRNGIKVIHEQLRLESLYDIADAIEDSTRGSDDRYPAVLLAKKTAKAECSAHVSKVVIGCILGVVFTIAGIIAFCNIWSHALTVVQIYLAPKVYLIEYAASLVK